jgi:hypothetical protein
MRWAVLCLGVLLGLGLYVVYAQSPGTCSDWLAVNNGAFGMGTGGDSDYSGEEGFEVLVFGNRLYVGMEADNIYGARLWRTKSSLTVPTGQSDWEEVVADSSGKPFGVANITQNDHIDSLAELNGYLYVSTANGGSSTYGTRIFRTATGNPYATSPSDWSDAIAAYGAGFGDVNNTNFKDMQVFGGWLCGGTQNWETGAQVWCTSDGITWTQKNNGGFGTSGNVTTTVEVWSGYVYTNALYFGAQDTGANRNDSSDDVARLFRTTDLSGTPTWTQVYTGTAGSFRLDILGELNSYLYISVRSSGGIVILRSSSGDAGSWTQVNTSGMDNNAHNIGAVVDGATVYNGALYVAVSNTSTGLELWRTTGTLQGGGPLVDWNQVGGSVLGDANNIYSELIPFNGYLYAWTSNYTSGQRVLRTKCPLCQSQNINGTGSYSFSGVGAVITFTVENLTSVEVCVYPDAFPTGQTSGKPVKRHYAITPAPADGTFTATLTLSYTDDEFTASDIADENTTYLTRWTGSAWSDCPSGNRSWDTVANTVTCSGVISFSTWAIAGSGASPSAVRLTSFQARARRNVWPDLFRRQR